MSKLRLVRLMACTFACSVLPGSSADVLVERSGAPPAVRSGNSASRLARVEALYDAVHKRDVELVKRILRKGVPINLTPPRDVPVLIFQIGLGNHVRSLEMAKLLISHGANINARTRDGDTPLHYAALRDRADIARLLVRAGANPGSRNHAGETPIMLAKQYAGSNFDALMKALKERPKRAIGNRKSK